LYGVTSNALPAANVAVRLSPYDPEAHYSYARSLQNQGQIAAALPELERATALQHQNFSYWMELAGAYDLVGRTEEAITAAKRAINAAPYYAQPHWQLGNLLLRKGRRQEAFAEFRLAVNSDSTLAPNAMDLAWGAFNGEAQAIEGAFQPQTPNEALELAKVFASRGAIDDAMRLFRTAANSPLDAARGREGLVAELFKAKRYHEAWEVWVADRKASEGGMPAGVGAVTDGGFEKPINLIETGFGWHFNPEKPSVSLAGDSRQPYAGTKSLQIRWEGKSYPSVYIASQLVLVEPNKHYRLSFAARTQDIVSGGLPEVVILGDYEGALLSSVTMPQGTTPWRLYSIEFTSADESRIVLITIRRKACPNTPCPAFGTAWFDDFSLITKA
jgi:Tfp pilus assembly protein PilF